MKRLLQIIVVWLMAVLLPMHGLAAATMMSVQGMSINAMAEQMQAAYSPADEPTHMNHVVSPAMDHAMDAEMQHAMLHHTHIMVTDAHGSSHQPLQNHQHGLKCAACSACCMATINTSSLNVFTSEEHGLVATQFFHPFQPSPIPHRLDRPPRTSLV